MADEFAGKLGLVTGAGRGIGRAVAIGLARRGAQVVAADLDERAVQQLTATLRESGLRCEGRKLDVSDADAVEMLVDELELEQPIELLANVAGTLEAVTAPDEDAWRTRFRGNTDGVFHVSRSVARRMKTRGRGTVVIVGANAARVPRIQRAAQSASNAAAHMFAKCLALELAEHGVRCSVIAPGSADTPVQRVLWADAQGRVISGTLADLPDGIPMRRVGSAEDVAYAALFLLSERARQLTRRSDASKAAQDAGGP